MWKFRVAAPAVLLLSLCAATKLAYAQAAKPDPVEAAAAMERAQRSAANPMLVILQAGKIRRKTGPEGEASPPQPADATNLRRSAARAGDGALATANNADAATARATTLTLAAALPARLQGLTSQRLAPLAPLGQLARQVLSQPAAQPLLSPAVDGTLAADPLLSIPAGNAVAAMDSALGPAAVAVVASLPRTATPAAALAASLMPPKLLDMWPPAIPPRVLDEVGRMPDLQADVTILPDGSVSEVNVLPPAPRQVLRYVVSALQKWRFEPMPATRVHRVQLVFSNE